MKSLLTPLCGNHILIIDYFQLKNLVTEMKKYTDIQELKDHTHSMGSLVRWFRQHQRSFPWRDNPSPYEVWISEVMLQQTQASVVIPYFKKWMIRFPTVAALAAAPLDHVLKLWEGLGYYSRARRLHAGAIYLLEKHNGELPNDRESLMKIPGLGPYTVGAILSFAFHQKAPAVDGNVARVITRYSRIEGFIEKTSVQKQIYQQVIEMLPEENPWVAMEALIELGALVCGRQPKCGQCPLHKDCQAFTTNRVSRYPQKMEKKKTIQLMRAVAVIKDRDSFLVERSTENQLMSHLCQFPFHEISIEEDIVDFTSAFQEKTGCQLLLLSCLDQVEHTFTHYRARLFPFLFKALEVSEKPPYQWIRKKDLQLLPFASGHRTIFKNLST